jgi:hypothetical protein
MGMMVMLLTYIWYDLGWDIGYLDRGFLGFSSAPLGRYQDSISIMPTLYSNPFEFVCHPAI